MQESGDCTRNRFGNGQRRARHTRSRAVIVLFDEARVDSLSKQVPTGKTNFAFRTSKPTILILWFSMLILEIGSQPGTKIARSSFHSVIVRRLFSAPTLLLDANSIG